MRRLIESFCCRPVLRGITLGLGMTLAGVAGAAPPSKSPPAGTASRAPAAADPAKVEKARTVFESTLRRFDQDHDYAAARAGFLEAIQLHPGYSSPRYNLGVIEERLRNWSEAVRRFEEFLKLDTTSEYAVKAQLKLDLLRPLAAAAAAPDGQRTLEYEVAAENAGELIQRGDLARAIAVARRASALDPNRWEAFALEGAGLAQSGLFEEAAQALRNALLKAPDAGRPGLQSAVDRCDRELQYRKLASLADEALAAKEYTRAAVQYAEASRLFPERGQYGLMAATAWVLAGDVPQAEKLLKPLCDGGDSAAAAQARRLLARLHVGEGGAEAWKQRVGGPIPALPQPSPAQQAASAALDAKLQQLETAARVQEAATSRVTGRWTGAIGLGDENARVDAELRGTSAGPQGTNFEGVFNTQVGGLAIHCRLRGWLALDGTVTLSIYWPDGGQMGRATGRWSGNSIDGRFQGRDPDGDTVSGSFRLARSR